MRRIRIVVLLLAVALAVPAALLVRQSLQGVAAEKSVRHRTVAERVFDEMERSLSEFLQAEEERNWTDYGAARFGAEQPAFVVGHFELTPEGRVRVPARAEIGEYEADRVEAVVARDLASRVAEADLSAFEGRAAGQAERQAPGTTVTRLDQLRALGYVMEAAPADEKKEAAASPQAKSSSDRAYDALQSLNLGVEQRRKRARKIVEEVAPPLYAESAPPRALEEEARGDSAGLAQAAGDDARLEANAPATARRPAAPRPEATAPSVLRAPAETGKRANELLRDFASELRDADRDEPSRSQTVQVAVDPLHGRSVDAEHLLLSRTVWIGETGLRQGLVLDRRELGGWLRGRIFAPLDLPGATLSFVEGSEPAAAAHNPYGYRHRFAEPFQGVTALLSLAPLAEVSGEGAVYLLAALLALVGSAGLFAIYRTVAVTVGFAERRSNFVAAVTHELKTPLTSIRMYGEMLRDDIVPDESKRREYYRTITAESERLGRLINNVLEFSRLERGTREMNLVSGDLGAVVREMAELVRPHAEAEGFSLDLEIEPDLPPVTFDRDALLQVLFNLIDNAVKYASGAAERRIRVACRARDGGVELLVRDHGPGVPGRHLARVFEPFYRGEDELTRRSKGTGLGLALVKGLAERMGAAIQGRNLPDGGFEVRIAF